MGEFLRANVGYLAAFVNEDEATCQVLQFRQDMGRNQDGHVLFPVEFQE